MDKLSDYKLWDPKKYLAEYYSTPHVSEDEAAVFRFIHQTLSGISEMLPKALEFGCGPTIHHAAALGPFVQKLDMTDYLDSNLTEVKLWLSEDPDMHNWDIYLSGKDGGVLDSQGKVSSKENLEELKRVLRSKVTKLVKADILDRNSLKKLGRYNLVASFYCVEAVSTSKELWKECMYNLWDLVESKGCLIMSSLRGSKFYKVGEKYFPNANITKKDFSDFFSEIPNVKRESIDIEVVDVKEWEQEGFDGIILVKAEKSL